MNVSKDLKWHHHVQTIVKKVNTRIGPFKNICKHASFKARKLIAGASILSVYQYGIVLWASQSTTDVNHVQLLQNKVLRLVCGVNIMDFWSIEKMLRQTGWFSVYQNYYFSTVFTLVKIRILKKPENLYNEIF